MRALIVLDKFKDSLTAAEACAAAAAGLRRSRPEGQADVCPLTDGGEGFVEILTHAAGGSLLNAVVTGPRGAPVIARYGLIEAQAIPAAARRRLALHEEVRCLAVIEMAQASGLALLRPAERDPWETSTFGTGELMRAAVAAGAQALLLGVGGSATNDLGLGALAALGVLPLDESRRPVVPPVPRRWNEITGFSGTVPAGFPPVRIACDVSNPLLGPGGCAAVFGAQKGLRREHRPDLENRSRRMAGLLCDFAHRPPDLDSSPGAGAAGGLSFGLVAAASARLLPGFELVADWLDLDRRIAAADVILTGEGCFDESSLSGKGPGAIARRALDCGKPVHVFAGRTDVTGRPGLHVHAITPEGTPLAQALARGREHLAAAVAAIFGPENARS